VEGAAERDQAPPTQAQFATALMRVLSYLSTFEPVGEAEPPVVEVLQPMEPVVVVEPIQPMAFRRRSG